MLAGHFRGYCVGVWSAPGGAEVAARVRDGAQAQRAGAKVLQTVQRARHFFCNLAAGFKAQVRCSHGDCGLAA
eukprot:9337039-Lingulodinium_polyedra.AAC.1